MVRTHGTETTDEASAMTAAPSANLPTVTYDPVEDVLTIALSRQQAGIHVYEVDDGLYVYINDAATVTHICAEQAALGRSESWRQHLGELAGSGALLTLDTVAVSGEPLHDRVFEFAPEELPALEARWLTAAAKALAERQRITRLTHRSTRTAAEPGRRPAALGEALRDRLARSIGTTVEGLRIWVTTLAPPMGFVEAAANPMAPATSGTLHLRVEQAEELGVEPEATVDIVETSAVLSLDVHGGRPGGVTALTAVLIDADGELVTEPVALAPDHSRLVARLSLARPARLGALSVVLFDAER